MKFSCKTEINSPLNKVIQLWDNPENLKKWQDGFTSYEHLSGTPGQPGAKAKIIYNNRNHVIELTETIINNNLPDELHALYEHIHMSNTMKTRFNDIGGGRTSYEMVVDDIKFNKFLPRIIAALFPGMFRKQSRKWLDNFKSFVENEK
jgi:hypothetical protein